MKTSKIIFVTLLGAIAFLILATMIEIRVNGRRDSDIQKDFKVIRKTLPSFKVVYMNNCMNAALVQNDSSFIEVTYPKDSIAPNVNYTINEDTLMMSDFEKVVHRNVSVRINATDSLEKIILKNSHISVESFESGKLSFDLDRGYVQLNQDQKENYSFEILNISAKNYSNFHSNSSRIDSLNIVLHKSQVDLSGIINKLSGSIADSSGIRTLQPGEISLKRDATSNIDVNNY